MGNESQIAPGVPDLAAAKRLPIADVADALSLERRGRMIRCWRSENHAYGDRTPSVGIWRRKNRVKCFVCDAKALSPIDLVMSVLSLDCYHALLWLDARFGLPHVPKGKHIARRSQAGLSGRVGVNGRLEAVIRSGLFAALSHAEIRLLVVLDAFADALSNTAILSYAALRRFSGLAKDSTVANALKRLAHMHAIEITRGRGGRGLAQCSRYRITMEHNDFLRILSACHATTREQIDVQRRLRAQLRAERRVHLKAACSNLPLPPDGSGNFRTTPFRGREIVTGNTVAPAVAVEEGTQ